MNIILSIAALFFFCFAQLLRRSPGLIRFYCMKSDAFFLFLSLRAGVHI